jgi:Ca2+-binding RTX toxin-like protein
MLWLTLIPLLGGLVLSELFADDADDPENTSAEGDEGTPVETPDEAQQNTYYGTDEDETLGDLNATDDLLVFGSGGQDLINSGDGDDTVFGGTGNDTIQTNDGDDDLQGGEGNDILIGGAGDDTFTGGRGADTILGGAGDDLVDDLGPVSSDSPYNVGNTSAWNSADVILTHDGNDTVIFGGGAVRIDRGDGDDVLTADSEFQTNSQISSSSPFLAELGDGNDLVTNDLIGDGTIRAGAGDDTIGGVHGNSLIQLGAGDDVWNGFNNGLNYESQWDAHLHSDTVEGGWGNDTLLSDRGNDSLDGGGGDDLIDSVDTRNELDNDDPRNQADTVDGGWGNDTLRGDWGDTLTGGGGIDQFEVVENGDDLHDLLGPVIITDLDPETETVTVDPYSSETVTQGADPDTGDAALLVDGRIVVVIQGVTPAQMGWT